MFWFWFSKQNQKNLLHLLNYVFPVIENSLFIVKTGSDNLQHRLRHFRNQATLLSCQSINPIFIQVSPRKWGWPDLPNSNSNLSNSHSTSRSVHGILPLQTNTLALLLHLRLPRLPWSSSPPLALHFKLQCFSQNLPIIPPLTIALSTYVQKCMQMQKMPNFDSLFKN